MEVCISKSPSLFLPPPPPLSHICSLYLWACFHLILFVFYILQISEIMVFCLSLTSLSMISSRSIHVVSDVKILISYGLSNIPLFICIFFVSSSISEHFSCFHILNIVNNDAMSWCSRIFSNYCRCFFFPQCKLLEVKLLNHTVVVVLIFEDLPYCFPEWLYWYNCNFIGLCVLGILTDIFLYYLSLSSQHNLR